MRHDLACTVVLSLCALSGCGGTKPLIRHETSAPSRPAWLTRVPRDPAYAYVVGVKTNAATLEEGKQQALASATAQAANQVETRVDSRFISESSSDRDADSAREQLSAKAAARIAGLAAVDEYDEHTSEQVGTYVGDRWDVYVLARYPVAAAAEERTRLAGEAQATASRASGLADQALASRAANRLLDARRGAAQARALLSGLDAGTATGHAKFGTVAALDSALAGQAQELDASARTVGVRVESSDAVTSAVSAAVSAQLGRLGLVVGGTPRFQLVLRASSTPAGQVFGQLVGHVTATVTVTDNWAGGVQKALVNAEDKGFGRQLEAAYAEAAHKAGDKAGADAAHAIASVLTSELTAP